MNKYKSLFKKWKKKEEKIASELSGNTKGRKILDLNMSIFDRGNSNLFVSINSHQSLLDIGSLPT
jgi:hypothetical protein